MLAFLLTTFCSQHDVLSDHLLADRNSKQEPPLGDSKCFYHFLMAQMMVCKFRALGLVYGLNVVCSPPKLRIYMKGIL